MLTNINKTVNTGKKVLASAVKIARRPSAVVIANEGLSFIKDYINLLAVENVAGNQGWGYFLGLPDALATYMFGLLEECAEPQLVNIGNNKVVKLIHVHGVDFRFIVQDRELMYSNIGVTEQQAILVLSRVIRDKLGPRVKYAREIALLGRRGHSAHRIIPLAAGEALPSKKGDELTARLQPFIDKGVNRSIFLWGYPGTGKTCLTEYIAEKIQGTCLTFEAAELFTMNITQMRFLLRLFDPDLLIVNDIDRAMSSADSNILGMLETISQDCKLTIVTANSINLTAAALRPGRFDEVVLISSLGDDTLRAMLKGYPEDVYDIVSTWPAAFINELTTRVDVLGMDCLAEEIIRLTTRVARNQIPDPSDRPPMKKMTAAQAAAKVQKD